MTSLVLFSSESSSGDGISKVNTDWGTGKRRTRSSSDPSDAHESGTFLYKGEPVKQNYRNTDLTLSNVRINDELIPAPTRINIASQQIPLKFPSNHPFTSHISEKAIFPNASVNVDDRPSTDTDPYQVTHKIRGNPFRREVHYQGIQRQQYRNAEWPDKQYMHLPRPTSDMNSSPIYPWPRKMFVPNENKPISNSGTNIVKNKEKLLFETTYQRDHSNGDGLGTHVVYDTTAASQPTESLKPFFKRTLDPARPMEGMQAIHIHGNHRQPSAFEKQMSSVPDSLIEDIKIMSQDEQLDDHLRNGTDYVNLPAQMFSTERSATWIPRSTTSKDSEQTKEIRYLRKPATALQIARDHEASHQQIEAENRLQQLEIIRPQDNICLLNLKLNALQSPRQARPKLPQYHDAYVNTFYDQVGTFIQERSGLYQTENYDPKALTESIPAIDNTEESPYEKDNQLKDAQNLMDLLNSGEEKQDKSKPNLFQYKTFQDYQATRNRLLHKFRVPQDSSTVDARVQEGENPFIQRESTYGQSYNTRKFLQENTLSAQARLDPTSLMSTQYNTDLERVRHLNSSPKKSLRNQSFNENDNREKSPDHIPIGPLLHPSPFDEMYSTRHINEHTDGYSRRSVNRVYDSPFKIPEDSIVYKVFAKPKKTTSSNVQIPDKLPRSAKNIIAVPGPEIVSRSVDPKLEQHSTYQHSYKNTSFHEVVFPPQDTGLSFDESRFAMKDNDERFGRTSDGRIKQWKLIDLQDRWTKTKAQKQYHIDHPEPVPYVGEGTVQASKEILIANEADRRRMMSIR